MVERIEPHITKFWLFGLKWKSKIHLFFEFSRFRKSKFVLLLTIMCLLICNICFYAKFSHKFDSDEIDLIYFVVWVCFANFGRVLGIPDTPISEHGIEVCVLNISWCISKLTKANVEPFNWSIKKSDCDNIYFYCSVLIHSCHYPCRNAWFPSSGI